MRDYSKYVLLPYTPDRFIMDEHGVQTMTPMPEMMKWLNDYVGKDAGYIRETDSALPWRMRPWQIGVSHAFFFYRPFDAYYFSLVWTGEYPKSTVVCLGDSEYI